MLGKKGGRRKRGDEGKREGKEEEEDSEKDHNVHM